MYLQLVQQSQQRESFNRGLAMMAAGLGPARDRQMMLNSMSGMGQDPNAMFNSLIQLQTYQQQQQQRQQFLAAAPDIAKSLSAQGVQVTPQEVVAMGPEAVRTMLQQNAPTDAMRNAEAAARSWASAHPEATQADIADYKAGILAQTVSGMDPATRAWSNAVRIWQQNPDNKGKPLPPEMKDPLTYSGAVLEQGKTLAAAANDRDAAQKTFADNKDQLETLRGNLQQIVNADGKDGRPDLGNVTGGQWLPTTGFIGSKVRSTQDFNLASTIDQVQKQIYGEAFRTPGGSRKTQQEIAGLAGGMSQLGNTNLSPEDYRKQAQIQLARVNRTLANLYGEAGYTSQLPDDLKGSLDASYGLGERGKPQALTGGASASPAAAAAPAADFSRMGSADADAAYEKLPSGAVFVDTDGKQKRKP
jgi:hypothetical protein